ncbi:hypothetical protein [Actinokineospora bangkokensis]|uniref:Uncharacterized protein n=1 Tax=Actinokineospora bangkokensis TaxID=1193682 RepID=A0A1Q9LE05_9PSEU|nr:hypothetical protein [Actinokineospora bangkokensis]OLR90242.1 hypothetical protein BJP25_04630 [Actinokineospora bangkokensis]
MTAEPGTTPPRVRITLHEPARAGRAPATALQRRVVVPAAPPRAAAAPAVLLSGIGAVVFTAVTGSPLALAAALLATATAAAMALCGPAPRRHRGGRHRTG